jgi:LacI family transcriptional regulator
MRGQPFSSDSDERWRGIEAVSREIGIAIKPELVQQLDRDISSPELGYPVISKLLSCGERFTTLVSFNDMAAIGAMRALEDLGFRVPADVSVIGFDDIKLAAFSNPRLTTIRQPLSNMGRIAAQCILNRLHGLERFRDQITVEPELVVRESTQSVGHPPKPSARKAVSR